MIKSILIASLFATGSLLAASGELQSSALKITASHQDAVVWLSVITKTTLGTDGDASAQIKAQLAGNDKEEKVEATGTIIDPSGLIVTALASIDKSSAIDGKTVNTGAGSVKLKASCEFKEIKVIMPDGTEIPADLVLKDNDLGIGIIRIRKDSKEAEGVTFTAVDVTASADGKLLDDCILLGRLGQIMNREPSVICSEISGITTKPRKFYRVLGDSVGCPIFLGDGKLLGITTLRAPAGDLSGGAVAMSPFVLPAADVAKLVTQAKAAPAVKAPAEGK